MTANNRVRGPRRVSRSSSSKESRNRTEWCNWQERSPPHWPRPRRQALAPRQSSPHRSPLTSKKCSPNVRRMFAKSEEKTSHRFGIVGLKTGLSVSRPTVRCQKLLKVLRRSLPHCSKLGNSQKARGIKFPKVLFWQPPLAGGVGF